ncbi:unnamed protein product, partial [Ixodes persulcatus]
QRYLQRTQKGGGPRAAACLGSTERGRPPLTDMRTTTPFHPNTLQASSNREHCGEENLLDTLSHYASTH